MPPHADVLRVEEPSLLHLIQALIGGDHMTSLIIGALGGLILMLNFFKIMKSLTDEVDLLEVLFPDKATDEVMLLTANL